MKQQHTPGPWHVSQNDSIYAKDEFIGIALSGKPWGRELPQEANARLMAAAPVMLEELEYARYALELASMAVPEIARERFLWQSKHLGRMIKLIEGDE